MIVRLKGGPGSGHHGHAGRPGHRGGSVPAAAAALPTGHDYIELERGIMVYHGTRKEFVNSIKRDGLKGRISPSRAANPGEEFTKIPNRPEAVYMSTDPEEVQKYIELRYGSSTLYEYAIVGIQLPPGTSAFKDARDATELGHASSFLVLGDVPSDWIVNIDTYQFEFDVDRKRVFTYIDTEVMKEESITIYVAVVFDSSFSKESSILQQAKQIVDGDLDKAEKTILERWRNHVGTTKLKQLPIDEQSKQNLLNIRLRMFYDESDTLAERMFTGQITLGDYHEQFKSMTREFHTSAAAIGKGGWDQMGPRDWGRLGTPLREQYSWMKGFVEYIDENRDTISLAQIKARARLYGDGAIRAAILIEAGFTIAELLPFLPKDGSTECLNRCHCKWTLQVTGKQGNFQIVRAVWVLGASDHCETCKSRDGYTEVIRVPIDVEVPSVIGGY